MLVLRCQLDRNLGYEIYNRIKLKNMENELSKKAQNIFEQIRQIDDQGNEYWGARQLAKVLDYAEFRNFLPVIEKAREACENSGQIVGHHLVEYHEEIKHGKGAIQLYPSVKLSRYACYLIVQNADPSKEIVATGQTYFAIQTRLQEISQMDEYNNLTKEEIIIKNRKLAEYETTQSVSYWFSSLVQFPPLGLGLLE